MRMTNPAFVLPDAMKGIGHLLKSITQGGVDEGLLELIGMRVSQINGCGACLHGHFANARKAGESDARLAAAGVWRDSPFFTDAEKAAFALAEAMTRLADREQDPVPDAIFDEAATHYDEKQLSAIMLLVGTLNLFNRLNVTVRERADAPSWQQ